MAIVTQRLGCCHAGKAQYTCGMTEEAAFKLNGEVVTLAGSDPTGSLLRWLNRHGRHGTKEGCADGDCGACTVAMVGRDARGGRQYQAVNSCLLPVGAVVGREIVSVEGVADGAELHPVQQAMVGHSGSQCGYCTPGFVMSLFAGYYAGELDDHATEGNLCRCTGYAPIRRATTQLRAGSARPDRFADALQQESRTLPAPSLEGYFQPADIAGAMSLKSAHPRSRWIAGATDLGVELSRGQHRQGIFIALDRIEELKQLAIGADAISIGAAVSLSRIERELAGRIPALDQMLRWFAARQVRNRATFGGNLGTASPIGDLLPVLLALDGRIELQGPGGRREIAAADFFTGYRQTARADDELVVAVHLPRNEWRNASFKVAKRQSDDISIVAATFVLGLDGDRRVEHVRLAYGGVAATPVRAWSTENFLLGRMLDEETLTRCAQMLHDEFTPLSDHRASAGYRRALCANLFAKFVAEQLA
jgi:xanthine dehydrogenase small subunit